MAFNLRNRNFLKELDFTPEELKFLLKLSAELYGEWAVTRFPVADPFPRHFAGGNISWTFGRFWLTAGTLVGLKFLAPDSPDFLARLMFAVAL